MRMRRNGYLGASGKHLDINVRFLDPDLLIGRPSEISAIGGRFQLILFHRKS